MKVEASITPDQDSVVCEIEIAAPPSRVWKALITSDELAHWWNRKAGCQVKSWQIDPRAGGDWECVTFDSSGQDLKNAPSNFIARGKIIDFAPPQRLAMTWEANFHEVPWQRTMVIWELIPSGLGTRVKVTHSGLKALAENRSQYAGGWPGVLEGLRAYLEPVA